MDDAQLTLKAYTLYVAGKPNGLTPEQAKNSDVNEDGDVSVDDAQNILIYYVNNTVAGNKLSWEEVLNRKPQKRFRNPKH